MLNKYCYIIKICSLENIANNEIFSDNDLYVTVGYNDEVRRTTTKLNTKNPFYNEMLVFECDKDSPLKFNLCIYESNITCDELLKTFTVDITNIPKKELLDNICLIEHGKYIFEKKEKMESIRENVITMKKKFENIFNFSKEISNICK